MTMSNSKSKKTALSDTDIGNLSGAGGSGFTRLQSSHSRLPSIRPKQDLTLGKIQKKTFAPTIPTSRRIKKEHVGLDVESVEMKKKSYKGKRISDKKGKKKERKEVITSESVFSMGPVAKCAQSSTSTGASYSKDLDLIKRRPDSRNAEYVSKEPIEDSEEENELGQLHSQKVEDLFNKSLLPPIQLPLDYISMQSHSQHINKPRKPEKELTDEDSLMDIDDSEVKPLKYSRGHQPTTAGDLFTTKDTSDGIYLFLQLPDHLPIAMDTTLGNDVEDSNSEGLDKVRSNILSDVAEGHIGKLNIHKSGKVRLILGAVSLDVYLGTPCGFLQELVSIRPSPPDFRMTMMGQLSHRLMCTPDFENILSR